MNKRKIIITTSHKPSPRTRTFAKELSSVLPNSIKLNRGKKTLTDLLIDALSIGANRVIVVHERKGNPSALKIYSVEDKKLKEHITLEITGVALWRELTGVSRVYNPESIAVECFEDELVELAERIAVGFNAKILYNEKMKTNFDVIISLKLRGNTVLLLFINPSINKIVGPILKLRTKGL